MVANGIGNAVSNGPDVFGSDNDPELVRDALPFGLKTMESLLHANQLVNEKTPHTR